MFVCAVTFRHSEIENELHLKMHSFMDQIERILVAVVLILLGGSVAGGILSSLELRYVLFGLAMIMIIRPLCAHFSVFRTKFTRRQKTVISFFGIKGVGSLFYLAFGLEQTNFGNTKEMWAIVSFIVLCSILIHGITATKSMERVDRVEEE